MTHKKLHRYTIITGLFVAVLLISNIVSTKIVDLGVVFGLPIIFDGGTLLFPLSYIFADVLTEVYGYRRAKQAIRIGFFSAGLLSLSIWLVGALPPAADRAYQESYMQILGFAPRIVLASLIAYLVGEFSNAYILARLKRLTQGTKFRLRAIGSTIIGQGLDTLLFVLIAFWGTLPMSILIAIIVTNYLFKVLIEVVFLPVTYAVTDRLKSVEGE